MGLGELWMKNPAGKWEVLDSIFKLFDIGF